MDQILTYILSAVGILGFFLAGRKVWWAWYVNIANQVLWTVFSVTTQQWGFLLATGFYFVVFSHNAYKWTKEYLDKKRLSPNGMVLSTNPKPPVDGPKGTAIGHIRETEHGLVAEGTVDSKTVSEFMSMGYHSKPHFKVDEETTASYMRSEGTNAAVSNDIAHVVSDVMRAQTGGYIHPTFTIRYGIAHEVQRRLDVKMRGTRPDVDHDIQVAIDSIDFATKEPLEIGDLVAKNESILLNSLMYVRSVLVKLKGHNAS